MSTTNLLEAINTNSTSPVLPMCHCPSLLLPIVEYLARSFTPGLPNSSNPIALQSARTRIHHHSPNQFIPTEINPLRAIPSRKVRPFLPNPAAASSLCFFPKSNSAALRISGFWGSVLHVQQLLGFFRSCADSVHLPRPLPRSALTSTTPACFILGQCEGRRRRTAGARA